MASVAEVLARYGAFVSPFGEGYFVPVLSYADESGTHDVTGVAPGSEVLVVAGYFAWHDQWATLAERWQTVLHGEGIEVFHLSDLAEAQRRKPESPYYGWDQDRIDAYMLALASVASEHTLFGVGGVVDVGAYHRLIPDHLKATIGHPYYLSFNGFFQELVHALDTRFSQPFPVGEKIDFFFDQQDEFSDVSIRSYRRICETHDPQGRFGTITFDVDRERFVPLQAADLLAGRARKTFTRLRAGNAAIPEGSWDSILGAKSNLFFYELDEVALREMAATAEVRDI